MAEIPPDIKARIDKIVGRAQRLLEILRKEKTMDYAYASLLYGCSYTYFMVYVLPILMRVYAPCIEKSRGKILWTCAETEEFPGGTQNA